MISVSVLISLKPQKYEIMQMLENQVNALHNICLKQQTEANIIWNKASGYGKRWMVHNHGERYMLLRRDLYDETENDETKNPGYEWKSETSYEYHINNSWIKHSITFYRIIHLTEKMTTWGSESQEIRYLHACHIDPNNSRLFPSS